MVRALGLLTWLAVAAVPAPRALAQQFAFNLTPEGLAKLEPLIVERLPQSYPVPAFERHLFSCPIGDDIVAHVPEVEVRIGWRDFSYAVLDDALGVDAVIDLDLETPLRIDEAYACFGTAECDVSARALAVGVSARVAGASLPDGRIELTEVEVGLDLRAEDFELDSEGCAVGDAAEWLFEAFEDWALERLTESLEEALEERLASALGEVLSDTLSLETELLGFSVVGTLTSVDLEADTGVALEGVAEVAWSGEAVRLAEPPPQMEPFDRPFPPGGVDGDFHVAASDSLITTALYEAWRGGLLTSLVSGRLPPLELPSGGVVALLGLPEETRVESAVRLESPLVATFGRSERGQAQIEVEGLRVDLEVVTPEESKTVSLVVDGAFRAGLGIDLELGGLVLELKDLDIRELRIESEADTITADRARLRDLVQTLVVPLLEERLGQVPVAPALNAVLGSYAYVRDLDSSGGWLRAGVDLVRPDPSDGEAPETEIATGRTLFPAGRVRVDVTGSDDRTPAPLLRYQAWLDGEALSEEPRGVSALRVDLADGEHTLEVSAVDLNGNVDRSPASVRLVADGQPPELIVADAPGAFETGGSIGASWSAHDEFGATEVRWEVRLIGERETSVVASAEFEAAETGSLAVDDLGADLLYELEVVARDEAGNETSQTFGFAMDPGASGGCSAGGVPGLLASMVLLLVGLLARSSRRSPLACFAVLGASVLVTLLAAGSAHAQTVGTLWSSPTTGDGAAPYFNPAAMAAGDGTHLELTGGLIAADLAYAPTDSLGESTTTSVRPVGSAGAYTDVLGEEFRLGLSVSLPHIQGGRWARDGAAGQITRYYLVDGATFHLSSVLAFSYSPVPWLSIGAGPHLVYGSLRSELDKDIGSQLNQLAGSGTVGAPFPYAHPDLAAQSDLSGSGFGVGAIAGVLVTPIEELSMGVAVHTPVSVTASGEVEVTFPRELDRYVDETLPGASLPELGGDVELNLDLPLMVVAGVAVRPTPKLELVVDYRFQQYSTIPSLDVVVSNATSNLVSDQAVVRGYTDRHSVGLRGSYQPIEELSLGALFRYQTNTVPETTMTPNTLEFEKVEVSVGVQWEMTDGVLLTAQYSHWFMPDRDIQRSLHRPLTQPSLQAYNHPSPTGTYRASANGAQLGLIVRL